VRQPQNLLALLLYGGLSLALFGPWILSRMSTFFLSGQPQDGSLFIWSFVWWPFAISHHLSAIFSSFAWAPGGINLTWATTMPGPAIALQALTKDYGPFFTFNVIELAAPALAAWTAYLLCRRIAGSFIPALIGGFFFGFSPALIDEVGQGHPSLALIFLVPVCAYLVVRLLEGSIHPLWYVQLLGIVLAVQLYIGEEIFATMTLVGGICALIGLATGPAGRRWRLLRAIAPTAGAYLVAAVLASPLLYTMFTRTPIVKAIHFATIGYGARSGNDFLRYVTPGRYTNHWGLFVLRWGDNPWYLGIPLIVVVILFAITERRRRVTWALFTGLVLILALSLGDLISVFGAQIMPWRLVAALPVLNVAQPGRLVTYFYLLIAVLVARWLTRRPWPAPAPSPYPPSSPQWRPTPRQRRSLHPLRWLIVILAGVTILPAFSTDVWAQRVPEPVFLSSGDYRHVLTRGEIVWVVENHADRQLVWQAETHFYFRLAGGFFGGTPSGVRNARLEERLAIGEIDPADTIADIRNFLAVHRVGAVMVSDVDWQAAAPAAVPARRPVHQPRPGPPADPEDRQQPASAQPRTQGSPSRAADPSRAGGASRPAWPPRSPPPRAPPTLTARNRDAARRGLPVGGYPGNGLAQGEGVNLLGALVGEHRLEVVRVPDHRVFQRDAVSAEHRPGLPGDLDRRPHVGHLAEADLLGRDRPGLLQPAEVQREQLRAGQVGEHPGELALGQLEPADLLAELLPGPGVVGRRLEAGAGSAGDPPHDAEPGFGQAGQRPLQAGHAGQYGVLRQPDLVEMQLGGHRGAQRHLLVDVP
jgi:hypothetical protein